MSKPGLSGPQSSTVSSLPPGIRLDKKGGLIVTKDGGGPVCGQARHPKIGGSRSCKLPNDVKVSVSANGAGAGDGHYSEVDRQISGYGGYDYQPNLYSLKLDFDNGFTLKHSISFYGYREDNEPVGLKEFMGGSLRLGYDIPYKPQIIPSENPKIGRIDCSAFLHYNPRFFNMNVLGVDDDKIYGGLNCGFKPTEKLSLRTTLNFFPDGNQQQPWDPDFTYSLLYRFTDELSFELSNYAGTRWPWNKRPGQSDGLEGHAAKLRFKRTF